MLSAMKSILVGVALSLVAVAAACSTDDDSSEGDESTTSYSDQTLEWGECEASDLDTGMETECATLQVPVDYDDPSAGETFISLVRIPASGDAQGTLFTNPGGPGESGVEFAPIWAAMLDPQVTENYDVVGFDPRGVGGSDPLECLDTAELDEFIDFDPTPETPEEAEEWAGLLEGMGEGCEQDAGALASHVTTVETARDLDVLRELVGDDQLTYYGASYGTFLGATYAGLFPEKVSRFVLDGAVDPEIPFSEVWLGFVGGFETALASYADDCVASGECPLGSTRDEVVGAVQDLFEQVDEEPLPTSEPDRPITQGLAFQGITAPLYSQEDWPLLTEAILSAQAGDGDLLLFAAAAATARGEEGYESNLMMAQTAIDCLDAKVRPEGDEVDIDEFVEASPTFGEIVGGIATLGCDPWPLGPEVEAPDYSASGAGPIVVVGTTRDPATPFEWAERLADILDSGVLFTRDGDGHTGYMQGNSCLDEAVNEYFVEGVAPDDGITC